MIKVPVTLQIFTSDMDSVETVRKIRRYNNDTIKTKAKDVIDAWKAVTSQVGARGCVCVCVRVGPGSREVHVSHIGTIAARVYSAFCR